MDVVNSEKIEETFGINGYYGDGQMMNWFAPPTTIQNVRGVDYESTPHGVPTDEFWWIKQNRYNRERIANNLQNTTVIYPSGLPSGDRLEDYFNAEGDKIAPKSKFVFNTDFKSFKKGDIIEGIVERNLGTSEPPNFFVSGDMRIGFGGRGSKIIIPYSEPKVERKAEPKAEPKEPKVERVKVEEDKAESELSADDKILGMPKMVAIGVGVVILAIGGFVVYKKFIK
jgi:hypothetical protein